MRGLVILTNSQFEGRKPARSTLYKGKARCQATKMNKQGTAHQQLWPLIKQHLIERMELNEVMPTTHAEEQMSERNISFGDVQDITHFWNIDEMYEPYKYPHGKRPFKNPDPVFSITGQDSRGRKLTIAFATKKERRELLFAIVTAFFEDELRKNRHQSNLDDKSL